MVPPTLASELKLFVSLRSDWVSPRVVCHCLDPHWLRRKKGRSLDEKITRWVELGHLTPPLMMICQPPSYSTRDHRDDVVFLRLRLVSYCSVKPHGFRKYPQIEDTTPRNIYEHQNTRTFKKPIPKTDKSLKQKLSTRKQILQRAKRRGAPSDAIRQRPKVPIRVSSHRATDRGINTTKPTINGTRKRLHFPHSFTPLFSGRLSVAGTYSGHDFFFFDFIFFFLKKKGGRVAEEPGKRKEGEDYDTSRIGIIFCSFCFSHLRMTLVQSHARSSL